MNENSDTEKSSISKARTPEGQTSQVSYQLFLKRERMWDSSF